MSFTQKKIIDEIVSRQDQADRDVELKRLTRLFGENDNSRKAKQVALSEKMDDLKSWFRKSFWVNNKEAV